MGLPELTRLSLIRGYRISDQGLAYLSGFGLHQPPAQLPRLQHLTLDYCICLTDLAIRHLSAGQPAIQQLRLSNFWKLSNSIFQWLATMRELRHLNVFYPRLTGNGPVELANAHSSLTYLDMSGCRFLTPKVLEQVGLLKRLRTLKMDNSSVSDAGLESLVKCGGDSAISYLGMCFCKDVTDDGMRHVAQLRQLRELCFRVGDFGLALLADGQSPVANVQCRDDVTDAGLCHVARLPNLRSLDLSDCRLITGAGLNEFMTNGRSAVTELRLYNDGSFRCEGLDASTLLRVAGGLPNLTRLWLPNYLVDREGMEAAARLLPRLQSLFVDRDNVIEEVRSLYDGHLYQ